MSIPLFCYLCADKCLLSVKTQKNKKIKSGLSFSKCHRAVVSLPMLFLLFLLPLLVLFWPLLSLFCCCCSIVFEFLSSCLVSYPNFVSVRKKKKKTLPVFPEVGSMMVQPGFKRPSFSASSTMRFPMRSLTEPPALKYSHLATTSKEGRVVFSSPAQQSSDVRLSNAIQRGHTELALKALSLGDLVNADQGSVSDVIQDGVEDSRLGVANGEITGRERELQRR